MAEQEQIQQAQPSQESVKVEEDEKFFAALGYFGPLFVLPLIVKPKSAYCKFHAKQSMVLFLAAIIVLVILASIPWFGSLLTLAVFALYVLAIYRAYKGDLWNIPVVANFAGKIDVESLYGKAGVAISGISGMKEKVDDLKERTGEKIEEMGKHEGE